MIAMKKSRPTAPVKAAETTDEALSAGGVERAQREREAVLQELIRAQRTAGLYPEGHPQRAGALAQSYSAITGRLKETPEMDLDVTRKGFSHRDRPIAEGNPSVVNFARELHLRQIKRFAFRKEMTLPEFEAFLRLLAMDPEEFRSGNLIEDHFRRHQVRGIWVNEIDFGSLRGAGVGSLEGEEEEEEEADLDQFEIVDLPEDQAGAIRTRILDLIAALDAERDPDRFLQLVRELEVLANELAREKNFDGAWVILAALSDHAEFSEGRSEVCQKHAWRAVRALAQRDLLAHLLLHYTTVREDRTRPYERVFRQLEMAALEPILHLLGKNEALYSYRRLLDFLVDLGPKAREPLEARLNNAGPHLARKIVFLLGELRQRESVEALRAMLGHPDSRIRREAVRSLAKIRGADSSRALLAALGQKLEPETKVLIVQTLGEMRDLSAVPTLIHLLRKRRWLDENYELLNAAAQALGQIGSKEALPVLIRTLHRRKWIQAEPNYRLRIIAAASLGQIGGDNAVQALKRCRRGKEDELEFACQQALSEMEASRSEPGGAP